MTMSGISDKEKIVIEEFRKRIKDVIPNDEFSQRDDQLIRWLRARELNLDKAEEMYRNAIKWRKENDIDNRLGGDPDPTLQERFPFYYDGLDKSGRPVLTIPYGKWDVRSIIEEEGPSRIANYFNHFLEKITLKIKKQTMETPLKDDPSACIQFFAIVDFTGYSYRQLANIKAVQTLLQTIGVYEAYYPETLFRCYITNAPTIFSILFGMSKAIMSGATVKKVTVFSTDKQQWLPEVLDLVSPDQIRKQFGGTRK